MADEWNEWDLLTWSCRGDGQSLLIQKALELDVTPWDLCIFEAIWYDYGQVNERDHLVRNAFFGERWKIDPKAAWGAVDKCFANGWIQYLSWEFLHEMQLELDNAGYLQPSGLIGQSRQQLSNLEGLISFTQSGVDVNNAFTAAVAGDANPGHWAMSYDTEDWNSPGTAYGTTIEECEFACEVGYYEYTMEHGEATSIGRWCDRWWNRFESGFTMRYWPGAPYE